MTREDFELLQNPQIQAIVEENLELDPARAALRKGVPPAAATQIKYLQRARTKLPDFYAARCILPPRAFEQASSWQAADHKHFTGRRCIDLTCGLGVDSAHFARHFDEVIAIENDPLLVDIARYNFARLGLHNVQVIHASAEEFVASTDLKADLVYADPDRRSAANRKLLLLEDYSPDIVLLHKRLHEISPRVVVKVSPLFDFAEAIRIFGAHTRVEAVSLGGELKELLIETGSHISRPVVSSAEAGGSSVEWPLDAPPPAPEASFCPPCRYLLLPDVALRKMRMARIHFLSKSTFINKDSGYAFADELPDGGMYRAWKIEAIHPYKPKEIKRLGFKSMQIMQRDFPLTNAQIAAQLGAREGGGRIAAFTTVGNEAMMVLLGDEIK